MLIRICRKCRYREEFKPTDLQGWRGAFSNKCSYCGREFNYDNMDMIIKKVYT